LVISQHDLVVAMRDNAGENKLHEIMEFIQSTEIMNFIQSTETEIISARRCIQAMAEWTC
jgi:hypothetical protein